MSNTEQHPALLRVHDGGVNIAGKPIWHSLNLEIMPAEIVAIIGENGVGKSTLLQVLSGQRELDAGTLDSAVSQRHIGFLAQNNPYTPTTPMRAQDVVSMGVDGNHLGIRLSSASVKSKVSAALAELGVQAQAALPIGTLSAGQQQRVRLAGLIAADSQLLLCDEPLTALDPRAQQRVATALDQVRQQSNAAIVCVTHELSALVPYVNRVIQLGKDGFTQVPLGGIHD